MKEINSLIEDHYYTPELFEDILTRLKEMDVDINRVLRSDIAGVDEFHVRGAEVSKELANDILLNDSIVLDVGCGLGGPSRMLADEFNCDTTGIDLSNEFIRTAQKLSELVGLDDKTKFIQADACNLPFEDNSFDVVWTQHVQMNIEDKSKFYSEIQRVLTDTGTFIYYDIFKNGNEQNVEYPVPWADDTSVSFLGTTENMDNILTGLNFSKVKTTDQTEKGTIFFQNLLEKIKLYGPPKLGLNLLMGESTKVKLKNVLNGFVDGKIVLQSGIYKK